MPRIGSSLWQLLEVGSRGEYTVWGGVRPEYVIEAPLLRNGKEATYGIHVGSR